MPHCSKTQLLESAYAAFNARNIDAALAAMQPDVEWANGMEGGYVHGHDAVRSYWTRQWSMIDSLAKPLRFQPAGEGRILVDVQVVGRDFSGATIFDRPVQHLYTFSGELVQKMEIIPSQSDEHPEA